MDSEIFEKFLFIISKKIFLHIKSLLFNCRKMNLIGAQQFIIDLTYIGMSNFRFFVKKLN